MKTEPGGDIADESRFGPIAIGILGTDVTVGRNEVGHTDGACVRKAHASRFIGEAKASEAAGAAATAAVAATGVPNTLGLAAERRNGRSGIAAPRGLTFLLRGYRCGNRPEPEQPLDHLAAIRRNGQGPRPSIESSIVHESSLWIATLRRGFPNFSE